MASYPTVPFLAHSKLVTQSLYLWDTPDNIGLSFFRLLLKPVASTYISVNSGSAEIQGLKKGYSHASGNGCYSSLCFYSDHQYTLVFMNDNPPTSDN